MTTRRAFVWAVVFAAGAAGADAAQAKLVAEWCEAVKLKAVGGYEACRFESAAEAGLEPGASADGGRCGARLLRRFAKVDAWSYGQCPTEGDGASIRSAAELHVQDVGAALAAAAEARAADACAAAKLRAVAAHAACRFDAEAARVSGRSGPEASRCEARLAARFARAEARGGESCPAAGDHEAIDAAVDAHVEELLDALGGPAPLCGNGIRSLNESCDGSDLGGADCAQLGYGGGGELACDGSCRIDASSCVEGPPCDALAQDCPLPGYGCYEFADRNRCLPAGAAGLDDACTLSTQCQAGLACTANFPGEPMRCAPLCDPAAPACPSDGVCAALGVAGLGVCIGGA